MASRVAIGEVAKDGKPHDDFSPKCYAGHWPHLDFLIDIDNFIEHAGYPRPRLSQV